MKRVLTRWKTEDLQGYSGEYLKILVVSPRLMILKTGDPTVIVKSNQERRGGGRRWAYESETELIGEIRPDSMGKFGQHN